MWIYWILFLVPALAAIQEAHSRQQPQTGGNVRLTMSVEWWAMFPLLTVLIGWRHEVGGDWGNYLRNLQQSRYISFGDIWFKSDPAYRFIEWIALQAGWGIHAVNFMAAAIFSFGLLWFCRHLARPWLALTISVPYLVVVLGMGYSRQGVALACVMIGIVALNKSRNGRFTLWTLLAAAFHKSSVVLLPMAGLAASRRRVTAVIWATVATGVAYYLFLDDSIEQYRENYLEARYQSEGAMIRIVMNLMPAIILLLNWKKFLPLIESSRLWFLMSISSVIFLVLFYISPSSTAIDRLALYILPLQIVVFSSLPDAFSKSVKASFSVSLVILYYAAVHFTWLNFAHHSQYWLPYKMYPIAVG